MASYSEIFRTNFKVLRNIGLWKIKSSSRVKNELYFFFQCFSLFFLVSLTILELIDLYVIRHDLEKFNFNLCASVTAIVTCLKTFRALKKLPGINRLRNRLNKYEEEEMDEECKKILMKSALEMKFINRLFYSMSYSLITLWMLTPLLDYKKGARKLPFRQWFPFDIQPSPNYELIYVYQVFGCFTTTSNIVSSDLATYGFLISISGQYDVLKRKLQRLNELYEELKEDYTMDKDEKTLRIIKDIIAHHQQIILRLRDFENLYSKILLLQFLAVTFLLAIIGVDVTLMSTEFNSRFVTQLGYLSTALVDLFFFCYYGTRLQYKSYHIAITAYGTPWYLMKTKFRSYLSFIMSKAQEPPVITGGKLLPINFSAYLKVLKTTYNMLMLFRQVASKSKK